jgi:hypothetical protein
MLIASPHLQRQQLDAACKLDHSRQGELEIVKRSQAGITRAGI